MERNENDLHRLGIGSDILFCIIMQVGSSFLNGKTATFILKYL